MLYITNIQSVRYYSANTNYRQGIYSPEEAARLLQDRYLDQQYYFGTERAVRFLSKTNAETV
jgi:hypothetical protein